MDLVFYLTVSWVIIAYFITCIKEKDTIKNIIVYMVMMFVIAVTYIIIGLDMELISVTKEVRSYITVLVHRDISVPFLMLIFISKYNKFTTFLEKMASAVLLLIVLSIFELINIKIPLYTYTGWNFMFSIIMNFFFILFVLLLNRFVDALKEGSENSK